MAPKPPLSKKFKQIFKARKEGNRPSSVPSHSQTNTSASSSGLRREGTNSVIANTSLDQHPTPSEHQVIAPLNLPAAVTTPPFLEKATASPSDEKQATEPNEFKATALGAFKTILEIGSTAAQAEPVGIAKAVFDSVKYVIGIVETTRDNANTLKEMTTALQTLSTRLRVPPNPNEASPELASRVDELIKELELIFKAAEHPERRYGQNIALREMDAANLKAIAQKIRDALTTFNTSTLIRQEHAIHQIKKSIITQRERELLDRLQPVRESAYNSARAAVISTCMPGTRVEVLNEMVIWFNDDGPNTPRTFWLNGIPGMGKSTIAKTIAQKAKDSGRLGASVFLSRRTADARLRDPTAVIPTIAYQLAQYSDEHKAAIIAALERDPDIATRDLAEQVEHLLQGAILAVKSEGLIPLVIMDAFDECDGPYASVLLKNLLASLLNAGGAHLKLLITSRPEAYIQRVFQTFTAPSRLVLHDMEKTVLEGDIRLYLERRLNEVAEELDYPNEPPWFTLKELAQLVQKSGKLFVYAATAIRFIESNPVANPRSRLDKVLGKSNDSGKAFASLDVLYLEILACVSEEAEEDLKEFRTLLASIILLRDLLSAAALGNLLNVPPSTARRTLRLVSSLIIYPVDETQNISIYHPSFAEFLMDKTRCTNPNLNVEPASQEAQLAIRCLTLIRNLPAGTISSQPISDELLYSCTYWASHLVKSFAGDLQLAQAVDFFIKTDFMQWLEVMSTGGLVRNAIRALQEAESWAASSEYTKPLVSPLNDGWRFISAFYHPIQAGIRYIYQSALPFCPRASYIWKTYSDRATIELLTGFRSHWSPLLSTLLGHIGTVETVAFSPDGSKLASGSNGTIVQLWDVASGTQMAALHGHAGSVFIVTFSPDGSRLATGSHDKTVRLWEIESGTEVATLRGHTSGVRTVAFLPNGSWLASGSNDKTVRLWDLLSGTEVARLQGHNSTIFKLAFSPDGSRLTSVSRDNTVRMWDVTSGTEVGLMRTASSVVFIVALSSNGSRLATSSGDNTVRLYASRAEAEILRGHKRSVMSLAFSPDASRLASGSSDKTVRIWDATSGEEVVTLIGHTGSVLNLAFSPDGMRLASGSDDCSIRLWDIESMKELAMLQGHTSVIQTIAFSPNSSRLASGSQDSTARLWVVVSEAEDAPPQGHENWILSLGFSLDGSKLASGSNDNKVLLWDVKSGTNVATLQGQSYSVLTLEFSSDASLLASGSDDDMIRLWDVMSGAQLATLQGHTSWVEALAFSPDGKWLASGARDETIRLWNIESGDEVATLLGHTGWVECLAFSPDGRWLASGSRDQTVRLWGGTGQAEVAKFTHMPTRGSVLTFSFDGSRLSCDIPEQTWDVSDAAVLAGRSEQIMAPADTNIKKNIQCHIEGGWLCADIENEGAVQVCFLPTESVGTSDYCNVRTSGRTVAVGCPNGAILILDLSRLFR